jgi:hypothetical protein
MNQCGEAATASSVDQLGRTKVDQVGRTRVDLLRRTPGGPDTPNRKNRRRRLGGSALSFREYRTARYREKRWMDATSRRRLTRPAHTG